MVYFDDVTNNNSASAPICIAHVRQYSELASDLQNGTVPSYSFITPNLCNDMHDDCMGGFFDTDHMVAQGDTWLKSNLPPILNSSVYQQHGAVFIIWDESTTSFTCPSFSPDCPVGMIILSPFVKSAGFHQGGRFDHSSTLKTIQEIFGVTPLLRAAGASGTNDLSSFFKAFP
jgi:phospholipase C